MSSFCVLIRNLGPKSQPVLTGDPPVGKYSLWTNLCNSTGLLAQPQTVLYSLSRNPCIFIYEIYMKEENFHKQELGRPGKGKAKKPE